MTFEDLLNTKPIQKITQTFSINQKIFYLSALLFNEFFSYPIHVIYIQLIIPYNLNLLHSDANKAELYAEVVAVIWVTEKMQYQSGNFIYCVLLLTGRVRLYILPYYQLEGREGYIKFTFFD